MYYLFVCFVCCIQLAYGQDPCTDSGTATLSRSVFNVPFCDASLSPIWYKIDEQTGDDIYTKCVTFGTCGTVYPLWMDGTIPSTADGIVDRTVCQVTPGDCCNKTYDIQVKNCGDFRVYKLTYTDGCYQAYCIQASADEVEDCGRKGNFKCGDGNSKVLIAITLVILFFVVIVAIVVWCYFRRRPSRSRKPFQSDEKKKSSNNRPPDVCINDPITESNF